MEINKTNDAPNSLLDYICFQSFAGFVIYLLETKGRDEHAFGDL